MSSSAQTLTYPVDQGYPLLQHDVQRLVKVGKHDGLGSGLNFKTLSAPDDVNWNEIHTWSAPDPFLMASLTSRIQENESSKRLPTPDHTSYSLEA
jgi:hypothetical protein